MTLGLRFWGTGIVVAGAAIGGCNVDPGGGSMGFTTPCYELQGDLTCESLYNSRPYCSLCTEELQGCVTIPPVASCRPMMGSTTAPPDDSDESSTGASSTGAGETTVGLDDTGSSTGEPPCQAEGELDPSCMELDAARPFCIDAACVSCDAVGGDAFCGERDELTPACDLAQGTCVACGEVETAVCGDATPVCDASGACASCTAHDQCPDTACHLDADDPLAGHCFAPDEVIWIDSMASCPGLGTPQQPACSLQDTAATLVPGDVRVLRIAAGAYPERASFSGPMTIAIIGTGEPEVTGNPGQQATTLSFDDGVIAYVDGVHLVGNALTHGLMCNSSTLYMQDTHVRDNEGWALQGFEPCTMDVRRSVFVGNEDGGLRIAGGSLSMVNSTVALNGIGGNATGVRLENAQVQILYSTIAGNDGAGADSIECTGSTGTLRNNIITGRDAPSIELECFPLGMEHNAMDAANFASGTNTEVVPYNEIYFNNPEAGDFRLSAPPLTPFGGVALWTDGDPERDADGTNRPTDGTLGYAGVDEP